MVLLLVRVPPQALVLVLITFVIRVLLLVLVPPLVLVLILTLVLVLRELEDKLEAPSLHLSCPRSSSQNIALYLESTWCLY